MSIAVNVYKSLFMVSPSRFKPLDTISVWFFDRNSKNIYFIGKEWFLNVSVYVR